MRCPTIEQITSPQTEKTGWPWSMECAQLPPLMVNGRTWPKISIVTPSFNQGEFLEETIRSILLQGYPNLEYIIIDGGSQDNSIDIIKKYELWLSYWVSEEDAGQANAINKGLKHCSGELFNWINSDDYLEVDALKIVAEKFDNYDIVAGSVRNFGLSGVSVIQSRRLSIRGFLGAANGMAWHQPGTWLRCSNLMEIGGLDENFHYCFDGLMMLRYIKTFKKIIYTDNILANFRLHDLSKTVGSAGEFHKDRLVIAVLLLQDKRFSPKYSREIYDLVIKSARLDRIEKLMRRKTSRPRKVFSLLVHIFTDVLAYPYRYTFGTIRRVLVWNKDHVPIDRREG